jgi:hypothetical protein
VYAEVILVTMSEFVGIAEMPEQEEIYGRKVECDVKLLREGCKTVRLPGERDAIMQSE